MTCSDCPPSWSSWAVLGVKASSPQLLPCKGAPRCLFGKQLLIPAWILLPPGSQAGKELLGESSSCSQHWSTHSLMLCALLPLFPCNS